jgi:hypothetical protein
MVDIDNVFSEDIGRELTGFLNNLGSDLLTQIEKSQDPLSMGYAKGKSKFIIEVALTKTNERVWGVLISVYKKNPLWLFGGPKQVASSKASLKDVGTRKGREEQLVREAISKMSNELLRGVAQSKEPITLTLQGEVSRQVEVTLSANQNEIIPQIFVD